MAQTFHDAMAAGYALDEPSLILGSPMDGITAHSRTYASRSPSPWSTATA